MEKIKRVIIATLCGVLFGIVCLLLASSGGALAWPIVVQIILSRTLLGFAIGISSLKMGHFIVHGLVMGMLFSLPMAFSGMMAPDNPAFSKVGLLISTVIIGGIYGLLTEVITSLLFKARQ